MCFVDPSKWTLYASIAQVCATIFTGLTTLVGVYALSEVRKDRSLRARPHLLLDQGGTMVEVEQLPNIGIPGVNLPYAQRAIANSRMQVTSTWHPVRPWGRLVNLGVGAAIDANVVIIAKRITRSGETFEIDETKLRSCPYELALNTLPSNPSHIEPGKSANFFRLPTTIVLDSNCAVSLVECEIVIRYKDIFGKNFENRQSLLVSDHRAKTPPAILLSIGSDREV